MNSPDNQIRLFSISLALLTTILILLITLINGQYSAASKRFQKKKALVSRIHLASPAIVPAGRNVAFESGNGVANAPASYLTMMDCCESDEAIADRIAMGQLTAKIRRKTTR